MGSHLIFTFTNFMINLTNGYHNYYLLVKYGISRLHNNYHYGAFTSEILEI